MLPAATLLPGTQVAIERYLVAGRRELRQAVRGFLAWLRGPAAREATAAEAQRRFTFLRLKFNAVLTQFDLFADVITQRSENETGVWLSGLDVVAADALALPGGTTSRRRSSAISIAASAPPSGARARACRAAARIRWRSSACRASAWSAPASPPRWCTRSGTRPRRCSIS